MNTPTYAEQYNKIVEAYFKDEIKPFKNDFCFCGTLCDNDGGWFSWMSAGVAANRNSPAIHYSYAGYSGVEIGLMEYALLNMIHNDCRSDELYDDMCILPSGNYVYVDQHPNYETALFKGMCAALETLRQIHEAKGDPTAKPITLEKRVLCSTM